LNSAHSAQRKTRSAKNGRIFVISAPSGCGKTTVCRKVLRKVKGLFPSVSFTTRRPRRGENPERDYFYITKSSFRKEIRQGNLLEWEENFGNLYGTPRRFVLDKIKKGKDLLLSIDVRGGMNVKRQFPSSVLIFLKPPSAEELVKRLKIRNTDRAREIARRFGLAGKELSYAGKYDYVVVNDQLEKAVKEITAIIRKNRRK